MKAYNSEVQESLSLIFNASRILFFEKTTIGLLTQYVKKTSKSFRILFQLKYFFYLCIRLIKQAIRASLLRPAPQESPRLGTKQGYRVVAAR